MDNCIYCSQSFDSSRGQGDHIITSRLGEFREDVRFRGICPKCNAQIGQSEQQLLQCGPEAFFRRVVRPATPPSRKKRGHSSVGAHGAPPPLNTVRLGDYQALVSIDRSDVRSVHPSDQLVVETEDGKQHQIKLFPGMKSGDLRARLRRLQPRKLTRAWLNSDPDQTDGYRSLLKSIWPEHKYETLPDIPAGNHRVDGRIRFKITDRYFRAIAKIGFHYYLAHTQRGLKGDEPCFRDLRRFIMEGGQHEPFLQERAIRFSPQLRRWFEKLLGSDGWCHILTMDETNDLSIAYVHLFFGPRSNHSGYQIRLGCCNTNIYAPTFFRGDVYVYDVVQEKIGPAGEVHKLPNTVIPVYS